MTINNANWASIIKSWRCALYATPAAGEVSVSKCVREQKPRNVAARSTSRASSAVARLFHSPLRSVTSISRTLFRTSIRLTERFHCPPRVWNGFFVCSSRLRSFAAFIAPNCRDNGCLARLCLRNYAVLPSFRSFPLPVTRHRNFEAIDGVIIG